MVIFPKKNINKLIKFLLVRFNNDGGFAAFPSLPSTIEDTFYAVDIMVNLKEFDREFDLANLFDRDKIDSFLQAQQKTNPTLPFRLKYFSAKIRKYLLAKEKYHPVVLVAEQPVSHEDYYYWRQLTSLADSNKFQPPKLKLDKCICTDVYYKLLSSPLPNGLNSVEIVSWLRKMSEW